MFFSRSPLDTAICGGKLFARTDGARVCECLCTNLREWTKRPLRMRSETSSREQAGPSSVELGTNAQHGTATAPDRPLRIAFFLGTFPVISETFILRQIAGLLALGHDVEIFADT